MPERKGNYMGRSAVFLTFIVLAGGCATSGRSKSKEALAGVTTVDQELQAAADQLTKAVDSLTVIVESPGADLSARYDQYLADLSDLDSKVQDLRDRALAMNARRDAYLKYWVEQTSKIQNADLKTQAEQRRTALMTDFTDLNGKGQTLKKAYAPLQASLHDCQRFLDSDLNPGGAKSLSGELEKIKQAKVEVDAAVKDFRAGLKTIVDKIGIPAAAPEIKPAEMKK